MPLPVDRTASRVPPLPAMLAAGLAVLSAIAPGVFFLFALAISGWNLFGLEWLLPLVPLGLSIGLLVGAVLLLLGRSWRVVAGAGAVLGLLLIGGTLIGDWEDGAGGFLLSAGLLPAVTAVLASLSGVRAWVAARQESR